MTNSNWRSIRIGVPRGASGGGWGGKDEEKGDSEEDRRESPHGVWCLNKEEKNKK